MSRTLYTLLLSAVLAAAAPACEDNNQAVIDAGQQQGMAVTGCSDPAVLGQCGNPKIKQACCLSCTTTCTEDDDTGFVDYMKDTNAWDDTITTCADAPSCTEEITAYCCSSCKNGNVTLEMPWVDDADPVQVYMSLGQSNCGGSASADLMKADGKHPYLFETDTNKSKVWFAGLTARDATTAPNSFGITAAWAGCVGDRHGPEFAYGNRLQELTGKRVLIFKYCMGGTSAKESWNPDFGANVWDKSQDNGTAAFLEDLRTGEPKMQQYLRTTYNLRLLREQLNASGVAYEIKGAFWRQGSADQDSDWQTYGADQIRLFNAMRAEVGVPDLPIIMEGDGRPNIQGGKVYAAQVLCHTTVGRAVSSQQDPSTIGPRPNKCQPKVADPCTDFITFHGELENQFGWPVGFPEDLKVPKPGHSAVTSQWKVRYQADPGPPAKNPNMHDDYDGMWWNGVAMANAYVREHTDIAVPHAITEWDTWAKWPASRCTSQSPRSATNFCWDDASATDCNQANAQEEAMCGSVTAESCKTTELHYINCPCACQGVATCTAEPPVIDRATLTYYPDLVPALGPGDEPTPPPTQGPIVCENDDAAIVDLAQQQGQTVTGCTAVANARNGHYCSYDVVANLCCEACAGQDAAGTRTLATGNPFDASQNETSDVSSSARQSRIWTTTFAAAGLAAMVVC